MLEVDRTVKGDSDHRPARKGLASVRRVCLLLVDDEVRNLRQRRSPVASPLRREGLRGARRQRRVAQVARRADLQANGSVEQRESVGDRMNALRDRDHKRGAGVGPRAHIVRARENARHHEHAVNVALRVNKRLARRLVELHRDRVADAKLRVAVVGIRRNYARNVRSEDFNRHLNLGRRAEHRHAEVTDRVRDRCKADEARRRRRVHNGRTHSARGGVRHVDNGERAGRQGVVDPRAHVVNVVVHVRGLRQDVERLAGVREKSDAGERRGERRVVDRVDRHEDLGLRARPVRVAHAVAEGDRAPPVERGREADDAVERVERQRRVRQRPLDERDGHLALVAVVVNVVDVILGKDEVLDVLVRRHRNVLRNGWVVDERYVDAHLRQCARALKVADAVRHRVQAVVVLIRNVEQHTGRRVDRNDTVSRRLEDRQKIPRERVLHVADERKQRHRDVRVALERDVQCAGNRRVVDGIDDQRKRRRHAPARAATLVTDHLAAIEVVRRDVVNDARGFVEREDTVSRRVEQVDVGWRHHIVRIVHVGHHVKVDERVLVEANAERRRPREVIHRRDCDRNRRLRARRVRVAHLVNERVRAKVIGAGRVRGNHRDNVDRRSAVLGLRHNRQQRAIENGLDVGDEAAEVHRHRRILQGRQAGALRRRHVVHRGNAQSHSRRRAEHRRAKVAHSVLERVGPEVVGRRCVANRSVRRKRRRAVRGCLRDCDLRARERVLLVKHKRKKVEPDRRVLARRHAQVGGGRPVVDRVDRNVDRQREAREQIADSHNERVRAEIVGRRRVRDNAARNSGRAMRGRRRDRDVRRVEHVVVVEHVGEDRNVERRVLVERDVVPLPRVLLHRRVVDGHKREDGRDDVGRRHAQILHNERNDARRDVGVVVDNRVANVLQHSLPLRNSRDTRQSERARRVVSANLVRDARGNVQALLAGAQDSRQSDRCRRHLRVVRVRDAHLGEHEGRRALDDKRVVGGGRRRIRKELGRVVDQHNRDRRVEANADGRAVRNVDREDTVRGVRLVGSVQVPDGAQHRLEVGRGRRASDRESAAGVRSRQRRSRRVGREALEGAVRRRRDERHRHRGEQRRVHVHNGGRGIDNRHRRAFLRERGRVVAARRRAVQVHDRRVVHSLERDDDLGVVARRSAVVDRNAHVAGRSVRVARLRVSIRVSHCLQHLHKVGDRVGSSEREAAVGVSLRDRRARDHSVKHLRGAVRHRLKFGVSAGHLCVVRVIDGPMYSALI
eukprot:Opistho-1_new@7774